MNQGKLSNWRVLLPALVALAMLVGAGCGGGDDDGDSGAAANSQTSSQASNQNTEAESGGEGGGSEDGDGGGNAEAGETGGDGEAGDGAEGPLLAEANTICAQSGEEYRQEATKFFSRKVQNREDEEEIYAEIVSDVTVPMLEKRIEDIQALSGASGEEEAIDEVSEKLEEAADEAEADPTAFGEGPVPAIIALRETGKELGLKECGLLG